MLGPKALACGATLIAVSCVACADLVGADFGGYNAASSTAPGSSDGTQPLPGNGGEGGGTLPDGGKKPFGPGGDGGGGDAQIPPNDSGPVSCVGPKPNSFPNKLSTLRRVACTTAQANAALNVFKTPGKDLADVYASMTPGACRDCV